jgi:hypothetical protein
VLTKTIIDGIKKAGLYEVLSSSKPFTAKDIMKVSRYKIRDVNSSDGAGVYARFHLTSKGVKYWNAGSHLCLRRQDHRLCSAQ